MVQDEWCVVQFRPVEDAESNRERWILGDVFLRAYDSVHDLENRRIGLIGKALTTSGRNRESIAVIDEEGNPAVGIVVALVIFCSLLIGFFVCKNWYDKY